MIITGVGDLIGRPKTLLASAVLIPISIGIIYYTSGSESLGWAISFSPYFFLALSLIIIRIRFQSTLDLLVIGWSSLLLTNIAIPINLMTPAYIEVFAIFSKIVIFLGMTYPRFSFMFEELQSYLIGGKPVSYIENHNHTVLLIDARALIKLITLCFPPMRTRLNTIRF